MLRELLLPRLCTVRGTVPPLTSCVTRQPCMDTKAHVKSLPSITSGFVSVRGCAGGRDREVHRRMCRSWRGRPARTLSRKDPIVEYLGCDHAGWV